MKLRNKKTGEIVELRIYKTDKFGDTDEFSSVEGEDSLAELNAEWEDYEKPKEYYWIDYDGKVKSFIDLYEWQDKMKEIGNYFETKEEAEKAVEKLKAWKRLKDKGIKFKKETFYGGHEYCITACYDDDYADDLDLLFGGEE